MSVSHVTWYLRHSWGEALAWQRIVWLPFGWHWLTCPDMTKSRKSSVWTESIKKNHANHAIKAIKIQSKWHIVSFSGVSLCAFVDPPWHRALHIWTWWTNNLQNTGRCTDLRHAKFRSVDPRPTSESLLCSVDPELRGRSLSNSWPEFHRVQANPPFFCHLPEPFHPFCSVSFHLSTFLHLNSCSFIETEAESSGLTFFKGQENRSPQIRHIQGGSVNFFCSRGPNRA